MLFHSINVTSDDLCNFDLAEKRARKDFLHLKAHEKLQSLIPPGTVSWEALLAAGDPVETLTALAAERPIDLVLAASHDIGLKRLLIGTVVERMVRRINCPLLVLRPSPEAMQRRAPCSVLTVPITDSGQARSRPDGPPR